MFYRLAGRKPVKCSTGLELAEWYEAAAQSGERIVACNELDCLMVSTVFTGIDPNAVDADPPQLFETMTFVHGKATGVAIKSTSWEQAERGHRKLVMKARTAAKENADN
jgi:hypothetical protein